MTLGTFPGHLAVTAAAPVERLPGYGREQATASLPHQRFPTGEVKPRAGQRPPETAAPRSPRAGRTSLSEAARTLAVLPTLPLAARDGSATGTARAPPIHPVGPCCVGGSAPRGVTHGAHSSLKPGRSA